MSTTRGCAARFYVGGTPTRVRENTDIQFGARSERIDVSEAGDCTKKFDAGATEHTATITCWDNSLPGSDPAPDAGQALLDAIGTAIDCEIRPNGDGSGKPQIAFNATVISIDRNMNGVNGVWDLRAELAVNGAVDTTAQV